MGIYTTPTALMVAQRRRFAGVRLTMQKMHKVAYEGGREDHLDYSDGSVSTKQLRAMVIHSGGLVAREQIAAVAELSRIADSSKARADT